MYILGRFIFIAMVIFFVWVICDGSDHGRKRK